MMLSERKKMKEKTEGEKNVRTDEGLTLEQHKDFKSLTILFIPMALDQLNEILREGKEAIERKDNETALEIYRKAEEYAKQNEEVRPFLVVRSLGSV